MSKHLPKGEVFRAMSDDELQEFREYLREHRLENTLKLWASFLAIVLGLLMWTRYPWHPAAIVLGIWSLVVSPYFLYCLRRDRGYYRWLDSEDRECGDGG